jgi:L-iditol 2-dehydrogenase
MRAAVLRGVGDVAVEERPVPEAGPGEVVVRVASVGVCGSDTHYYEHGRIGRFVVDSPLVLGHEAAGEVAALGPGVTALTVGQRVSVEPGVPDLTCPQCLAGRYNLCPGMRFFATPPIDGAFAEYVVVHAAFAHPVPDTISDDAAALLEPLSVGIWACRKAEVRAGDRVLVTGAGPIGLLAMQVARASGATELVVSDTNEHRLALARRTGATRTVAPGDELGEVDALIECSGHPAALADGIAAIRPAGTAVIVGMGPGDTAEVPLSLIQNREIWLTGTFRYANTYPTAIALAASGRVDLRAIVTGRYPLDDAEAALRAGRADSASVKVMVLPGLTPR